MKVSISKISDKGQITVPKLIRDVLSLSSGDLIQYEVIGNIVNIKKLNAEENTYLRSIEPHLDEWQGTEDDDL